MTTSTPISCPEVYLPWTNIPVEDQDVRTVCPNSHDIRSQDVELDGPLDGPPTGCHSESYEEGYARDLAKE